MSLRTPALLDLLRAQPGRLFATLDAARSPAIWQLIETAPEKVCLFDAPDDLVLAPYAPYLIACDDDAWLTRVLDAGWGQSWGIFLTSKAKLRYVRAQLCKVIDAKSESGDPLVFRFYDPRVARTLLPRATAQQAATLFDEVDRYLMEDDEPSRLLCFERNAARIDQTRILVSPRIDSPTEGT